jgi:hypothetical protein
MRNAERRRGQQYETKFCHDRPWAPGVRIFNKLIFVGRTNRHIDQLICIGPECGDRQMQIRFYFRHDNGPNALCSLRVQGIDL